MVSLKIRQSNIVIEFMTISLKAENSFLKFVLETIHFARVPISSNCFNFVVHMLVTAILSCLVSLQDYWL